MSRRNQARRRRSYARRQHELRERREPPSDLHWTATAEDFDQRGDGFAPSSGEPADRAYGGWAR